MSPEREAYKQQWIEFIRGKVVAPLATVALFGAEQVGKHISFDNDYPDEEEDQWI